MNTNPHEWSGDEGSAAAVAWARLGMSMRERNEAMRMSVMAANVAEISVTKAAEHLSALFGVYGLRAAAT